MRDAISTYLVDGFYNETCHKYLLCEWELSNVFNVIAWAPAGMLKEGHLTPWTCCGVLFVLQMLSNVSVDEVFMHYFEKMSSHSGAGFLPLNQREDFVIQTSLIAHPWKKSCGLHAHASEISGQGHIMYICV